MIYKVFYQETKERNPRREQTKSLYHTMQKLNLRDVSKLVKSSKKTLPITSNSSSSSQKKPLNTKKKQAFLK